MTQPICISQLHTKMHNLNQMPYPLITILFLFSFNIIHFPTLITSKPTTTLYSPITRDDTTNLYTIQIYLKTPLQPSQLHLDLGSYLPWYDCSRHYKSSSYQPVIYNTSLCLTLDTKIYANCFDKPGPGCSNDTCGFYPENPVTGKVGLARLITDKFTVDGSSDPGRPGPVSEIVLACSFPNAKVYRGLAKGSKGLATLGRFNYSLSGQISRNFDAPRIFALCLPRSSKAPGVVVFNSPGPYNFSPDTELSKSLVYTPLIQGPRGSDTVIFYWYKSPDYYIGLTSFKVNEKSVPLNQTLLAIDENGLGGTKLSTSHPYTLLQTSIFKALTDAFVKEIINVLNLTVLVKPVDPFKFCYSADAGASTPTIDLVMGNGEVAWRIYGSNSMVRIKSGDLDVWCLGFVDGGLNTKTSIVIGGYQVEDNLLQFDLEKERLGFSSSLLVRHGTSCANFKV